MSDNNNPTTGFLLDRIDYLSGQISVLASYIINMHNLGDDERKSVLELALKIAPPDRAVGVARPSQGAKELFQKMNDAYAKLKTPDKTGEPT